MISGLKPYPEYKDSGQSWIGSVPKHWGIFPNRSMFQEIRESGHSEEQMLSVTITRGIISQKSLLSDSSKKDSSKLDKSKYKLVEINDIAYNKMRAWQGAIGVSDHRGIISPAYIVVRLRKGVNQPKYFHHLYRTPQFAKEAERWSYGITSDMWSLRPEHFKMIYTPEPPVDEQKGIVKFLNWANGQLERAIRAKRKTIGLLNEQKQAIIHRAVTRGLNPNAPLKPSGIPWMGEVPNHWETKRIRACLIDTRTGIWGDDPIPENRLDHVTCIRVADFDIPQLKLKTNKLTLRAVKESARSPRLLQKGDILLEKSGGGESEPVGRVVIFDLPLTAISSNFVIRLRMNPLIALPEYLLNLLAFMQYSRVNVPHIKQTTGIQNLSEKSYLSTQIAIPEPIEQAKILAHISNTLLPLNKSLINIEKEIALLREYRTRLVADVVTGKLDVRAIAAKLPDENLTGEAAMPEAAEESETEESAI